MINLFKDFFFILTPNQKKKFYLLQLLFVLMAFTEIIGIASIAPFMALVGDIEIIQSNDNINMLYHASGVDTTYEFAFIVGLVVLFILTISSLVSTLATWKSAKFAAQVGAENADRLYSYYLSQNWLFHASGSSAELVKQISSEVTRVTDLFILPLVLMISKLVLVVFLLFGLFFYEPIVAMISFTTFGSFYFLIFFLVKKKLAQNGVALSSLAVQRFSLMNEAFGGIKDVILLNRKKYYTSKFNQTGKEFSTARAGNHILWQIPKYFVEFLAYGVVIILVLYLLKVNEGNIGSILPMLSIYALAGFKLLPALQQIYASVGQIKGNVSAFDSIKNELAECLTNESYEIGYEFTAVENNKIEVKNNIKINNVNFSYPGKTNTLNSISLDISAGSVVGFVGPSGAGKSTIIEVILALIQPQSGSLIIDNIVITEKNRVQWQSNIGFVPQSIFLTEGTIAQNVAFGLSDEHINLTKVEKALKLANLEELVETLELGLQTKVGERGVQLSGGQRQRIGIARALYDEPEVLVFDEATSALDGITENVIMKAIHNLSGHKTIIMIAHRVKTVQKCDQIFYMCDGQIKDRGTYNELIEKNSEFKRLTKYA